MFEALESFEKSLQDQRTERRFLCVWLKEAQGKTARKIADQVDDLDFWPLF